LARPKRLRCGISAICAGSMAGAVNEARAQLLLPGHPSAGTTPSDVDLGALAARLVDNPYRGVGLGDADGVAGGTHRRRGPPCGQCRTRLGCHFEGAPCEVEDCEEVVCRTCQTAAAAQGRQRVLCELHTPTPCAGRCGTLLGEQSGWLCEVEECRFMLCDACWPQGANGTLYCPAHQLRSHGQAVLSGLGGKTGPGPPPAGSATGAAAAAARGAGGPSQVPGLMGPGRGAPSAGPKVTRSGRR